MCYNAFRNRSAIYLGLLSRKLEAHGRKGVCFFMFKKEWKLYLFYNGIMIKKLRIYENEAPADNVYFVRVWGKKNLFGSNMVKIAVRPKVLLHTNEINKSTYWGVVFEKGVNIE